MSRKKLSGNGWEFIPADKQGNSEVVKESLPVGKQNVSIKCEKRNKGKVVTVVSHLVLTGSDMKALAKELKNLCGSGGKSDNSSIEIQGENTERIREYLRGKGYKV